MLKYLSLFSAHIFHLLEWVYFVIQTDKHYSHIIVLIFYLEELRSIFKKYLWSNIGRDNVINIKCEIHEVALILIHDFSSNLIIISNSVFHFSISWMHVTRPIIF